MHQAYKRLSRMGWRPIASFKPRSMPFGDAPFLVIEADKAGAIECEYDGQSFISRMDKNG
jgi:hypothetical protein